MSVLIRKENKPFCRQPANSFNQHTDAKLFLNSKDFFTDIQRVKKSFSLSAALIFSACAVFAQNSSLSSVREPSINGGVVRAYDEKLSMPEEDFDKEIIYETEVPALLKGIWCGNDRYIVFEGHSLVSEDGTTQIEPDFVLRTFYTWYDDFACGNISNPDRNNTTTQEPVKVTVSFKVLTESETSGAWDMTISYSNGRDVFHIPLAVIDNKIYLSFKINTEPKEGNNGYWQDYSSSKQITICNPVVQNEITSYYITPEGIYHIRYWQTKMDYDKNAMAVFSDGEESYYVKKHLVSSGKTYTCVNGRSTTIRNIEKSESLEKDVIFNAENTILASGKPYLTLEADGKTMEQIMNEANSRHKPLPKPVFPPADVNFHWEIIRDLREYSSLTVKQYNRNLSFGKD